MEAWEVMVPSDEPRIFSTHGAQAAELSTSDPNHVASSPQPSVVGNPRFPDEENGTVRCNLSKRARVV